MAYYIAPFTFYFETEYIDVDGGITDVDVIALYDAIKIAQASEEGIIYDAQAKASGLQFLGPGVQVGLTVELLRTWQLRFPAGNYIARVAGGNLIGGPAGDPIAYSAGVQTLLIYSAAATVVSAGASVPTASAVADAVRSNLETGTPVPVDLRRVNNLPIAGTGVTGDSWRPA